MISTLTTCRQCGQPIKVAASGNPNVCIACGNEQNRAGPELVSHSRASEDPPTATAPGPTAISEQPGADPHPEVYTVPLHFSGLCTFLVCAWCQSPVSVRVGQGIMVTTKAGPMEVTGTSHTYCRPCMDKAIKLAQQEKGCATCGSSQ